MFDNKVHEIKCPKAGGPCYFKVKCISEDSSMHLLVQGKTLVSVLKKNDSLALKNYIENFDCSLESEIKCSETLFKKLKKFSVGYYNLNEISADTIRKYFSNYRCSELKNLTKPMSKAMVMKLFNDTIFLYKEDYSGDIIIPSICKNRFKQKYLN